VCEVVRRSRLENRWQEAKHDQDAEQRLDARVAEAQRRCALVIDETVGRLVKRVLADVAVRADSLDVKQTSVGLEADVSQRGGYAGVCRYRSRGCR